MTDKFRSNDSKILADYYVVAEQFINSITNFAYESDVSSVEELPESMVPTDILLNMCLCYTIMYNKLTENQLLSKLTSNKLIQ